MVMLMLMIILLLPLLVQVWGAKYNATGSKIASVSDDKSIIVYNCPL